MSKTKLFFFLILFTLTVFGQKPYKYKLIADPVVGSVTQTSAKIWIAYKGNGENIVTLQDTLDKRIYIPSHFEKIGNSKEDTAMIIDFAGLLPDHTYRTLLEVNEPLLHHKATFTTQADTTLKDFNFLLGSCALMNTDFTRFAFPGFAVNIFWYMKRHHSDFMVWLGDNLYYLGKQATSYDRMFDRNLKIRRNFLYLQEFLATQPHYAIWDDHDYGWNDSDRGFALKNTSLKIFKGFWPNTYDNKDTFAGNYFTFKYYDTEFFMTDNRYYRAPDGDTLGDYFGPLQINWLKEKLKNSTASFKFICTGSQVLNDCYGGESYAKYPRERNDLLNYIVDNNITGVIFLTGDKHYTELSKRVWKGYTFYDFTSSPLTSPIVEIRSLYKNTYNVPGTILYHKNFGKIFISGPKENRVCKMEIYSRFGNKKWDYSVNANDIRKK